MNFRPASTAAEDDVAIWISGDDHCGSPVVPVPMADQQTRWAMYCGVGRTFRWDEETG